MAASLRSSSFLSMTATQFLGAMNDNIFKNALVILITYRSMSLGGLGPAELVALSGALFILPFFCFSGLAGEMADKTERSRLVFFIKLGEVMIMILASLGLYYNHLPGLLFVLFLMGAQSTFFGPLKYGMLKDMVGVGSVVRATALTSSLTFFAILIGTMLGGLLAALEVIVMPLSLCLIAVSLMGVLSSLGISPQAIHSKETLSWNPWRPTVFILRWCRQDKKLFESLLSISWFWLFGAVVLAILPTLVKENFFGSEEVSTFLLMLFTIGMGIGAWMADRIGKKVPELGLVPICTFAMSIFFFDLAYEASRTREIIDSGSLRSLADFLAMKGGLRASLDVLGLSIFGGAYIVPLMSFIQTSTRDTHLSRVIAGNNVLNAIAMVVGSIVLMAGYALQYSVVTMIIFFGVLNLAVSFLMYSRVTQLSIRLWAILITKIFYSVKITGLKNLPKNGPYIIVANHISFIDWLMIMTLCPHPVRFVIDHNYYFAPGLPFWLRQAKLIPIAMRKESEELLTKAFDGISNALNAGDIIGLFPEGALSRTGQMRAFQPGLSKILKRNPVPVVPVAICGLWGSNFSHSAPGLFKKFPKLNRPMVELKIGQVMTPEEFDLRKLNGLVQEMLAASMTDSSPHVSLNRQTPPDSLG